MKNTLLFIYSTNILVGLPTVHMKNCLTPRNPKMCDPILVTLLKIRPHYSQSSRENATPSSCTSPLASYKEVPLPPGRNLFCQKWYIKGYGVGPQGGASPYKTFLSTSPTGLMRAFFSQEIDLVYGL